MNGQDQRDKYIRRYREQIRREMDAMGYPGNDGRAGESGQRGRHSRTWQMVWSPASDLGPLVRWPM